MIIASLPCSVASPPAEKRIEGIRANAHHTFSRIVFDLNRDTSYEVHLTAENVITVSFANCTLSDGAKGKRYSDALIRRITCEETPEQEVVATIVLDGNRRSFSHTALARPPRIVLDISEVRARSGDEHISLGGGTHNDADVAGMTPLAVKKQPAEGGAHGNEDEDRAETAEPAPTETIEKLLVSTDKVQEEDPLVSSTTTVGSDPLGDKKEEEANQEARRTYSSAIELFKQERYREALNILRYFTNNYPHSKLASAVSILIGDCYYYLAEENSLTSYQPAIEAFQLALAFYSDSEDVDRGYFQLANSYRKMGYHLEAYENYKLLLENHPESNYIPDAHFWMAESLYQDEEFERARDIFQQYLIRHYQGAFVRKAAFRAADCLVGMKEYGKALQSYQELLSQWPDHSGLFPETLYSMGIAYLENGNYQSAQSTLFIALNVFPEQEYNHIILTKIGDAYQMEGKIEEALKVYSQNNVLYRESEGAMISEMKMADIGVKKLGFFNFNQCLDPLNVYQQIIEKYPATNLAEEALYKQGVAYSEQRKYKEAVASLKTVLEEYPDSELSKKCLYSLQENLSKLIESYFSEEKYYPVLVLYRKHKDLFLENNTNTGMLFRIGESFRRVGLYDNALELYEQASRISSPTHPEDELILRMGEVYLQKKEYGKADTLFHKMLHDFPGSRFRTRALHALAETYVEQQRYNEASLTYLAALEGEERTPLEMKGLFCLGKCYQAMGNTTLAVDAYRKAIMAGEESAKEGQEDEYLIKSYFQLGDYLFQTHQYAEAIEIYARIVERYPENERTQWALYRLAAGYRMVGGKGIEIESLKKLAGQGQKETFWAKVVNYNIRNAEWEITHHEHLSR